MSWFSEVSVNVASAVITAGVAVAAIAQVKAYRINSMLGEIDDNLERMLHDVQHKRTESDAAAYIEHAKAHMLKIQDEAINDSSKGLRLSRHLVRELESIKREISEIDERRLGRMVLKILFSKPEGDEFLSMIRALRIRISQTQVRIFFMSFFTP